MFKTHLKSLLGSVLIGAMAAISTPAMATNEAMLDLLKILKDKGSITEEEYKLLTNASKADGEKVEGTINEMKADVAKKTKDLPKINTKGKLEIKSADGNHKFRFGGRLQHDYYLNGSDGGFTNQSVSEFARARLFLSGTTHKYWKFKFQYDFIDLEDSSQGIEDAYISYTGFDSLDITLGQKRNPFSASTLISSKHTTFIDRPVPVNLFDEENIGVSNRAPGITLKAKTLKNSVLEGGFYGLRQASDATDSITDRNLDDGFGFTGRAVHAPIYDKKAGKLLALGVSGGYRFYPNGFIGDIDADGDGRIGTDIIESANLGTLGVDEFYGINANIAGQYNGFWGLSEYFYGEFDGDNFVAVGDRDIEGWYIEAGAFLTNDHYSYKKGHFNGVKVKNPVGQGGIGAWSVAFQYDQAKIGAAIDNGEGAGDDGSTFTAALNWYPISNIRAQLNYIKLFCDDAGDCEAVGEPNILGLRTQIFF